MDMSASAQVAVRLAGQEAIAGHFGEIGVEQLFLALMKLSELPVKDLGGIAGAVGELTAEVQALRHELIGRGIDGTLVRRRLRAELGRGACKRPPNPIHRSGAAKRAFEVAARLAHEERAPAMTAVHLLRALLASPTPAMVKVLGAAARPSGAGAAKPLLDRCAKDLTRLAKEGKLAAIQGRQAETKALLGFLASGGRSTAFLVTDPGDVARDVVIAAAVAVSGGAGGPSLKDCRILDVTQACRPDAPDGSANLQGILEEVAGSSSIVLFIPPVVDTRRESKELVAALRASIEKLQAKIICRVSADAYAAILAGDSAWKRLAQPIWLRERVGDEVPQEL